MARAEDPRRVCVHLFFDFQKVTQAVWNTKMCGKFDVDFEDAGLLLFFALSNLQVLGGRVGDSETQANVKKQTSCGLNLSALAHPTTPPG